MKLVRLVSFVAPFLAFAAVASAARADTSPLPPWTEVDDMPLPRWARSITPKRPDVAVQRGASATDPKRGVVFTHSRLPLFGARRGPGCGGRWLLVGSAGWICSDAVDVTSDEPSYVELKAGDSGLPFRYFFTGRDGANGYSSLPRIDGGLPDVERDPGAALAVEEERTIDGEAWVRTHQDHWFPLRELLPARPSDFAGTTVKGELTVAWVVADKARLLASPSANGKSAGELKRFARVAVYEEAPAGKAPAFFRISEDGAPAQWVSARDVARPRAAPPPPEVAAAKGEAWIDVDIASQTLVAYEGTTPVYATLVSTGRGPEGTDTATRKGSHRVWVKLTSSTMASGDTDGDGERYSIEDVPYVQFFDGAIALHGAFWHRDFGRVHSHGCVNLAPKDAAWLFRFTGPHLPRGWAAVLPTSDEPGTLVRVR